MYWSRIFGELITNETVPWSTISAAKPKPYYDSSIVMKIFLKRLQSFLAGPYAPHNHHSHISQIKNKFVVSNASLLLSPS